MGYISYDEAVRVLQKFNRSMEEGVLASYKKLIDEIKTEKARSQVKSLSSSKETQASKIKEYEDCIIYNDQVLWKRFPRKKKADIFVFKRVS